MYKKGNGGKILLCFLLLAVLVIGVLPGLPFSAQAAEKGLSMEELMEKFPNGKYWNGGNADSWTETPCNHHGSCPSWGGCGCNSFLGLSIQCMGFAEKLGYDATTYNPRLNANGWYRYFNKSSLDTLKPGDIVRISSASGYGHSIYVTAVDGENVTYADCNSRDRSCNIRWGATTTKSHLRSIFEWVQSAPEPLRVGYLAKCEKLSSSGTVTAIRNTILRALPCSDQTDSKSVAIYTLPKDSKITVTALYRNSGGNYWYKTSYNGQVCYMFSGDADHFAANNKITISGVSAPLNTKSGSGFPIEGKITSSVLNLNKVGAYVYTGTNINATPYMSSEASPASVTTYEIYGSSVDNNLKFGKIALGDYTYVIKATTISYSANKNILQTHEQTKKLHQNTFKVTSTLSCSHQYTKEVVKQAQCGQEGSDKYTCSKCKYAYVQTTFSDGTHNYKEQVTPPSCIKQGYTTYTCSVCSHSYVGNQTAVVAHQDKATGTVAPTCTQKGYTNYACTVCGRSYQADILDPMGHDETIEKGYPATCTEVGRSDKTYCSRCSWVQSEPTVIPAVGHSYEAVAAPPRDGAEGYTTYTCFCGDSYVGSYVEPKPEVLGVQVMRLYDGSQEMLVRALEDTAADGYLPAEPKDSQQYAQETVFVFCLTERIGEGETFTIQDAYGRYLYMADTENFLVSDILPEKGFLWQKTAADDSGKSYITNFYTGKTIGYDAQLEQFGAYAEIEKHTAFELLIEKTVIADMNADNHVDNLDVEYLLWYTLFPEDYPLNGNADYNDDGMVDNRDVEHLLWHTLFPEDYPVA